MATEKIKYDPKDEPLLPLLMQAFREGHAWNPATPHVDLKFSDLNKLTKNDQTAKDLIASFQGMDYNLEELVKDFHGRAAHVNAPAALGDGDPGPATYSLLNLDRCPIPTYAPPPETDFSGMDPDLSQVMRSYQKFVAAGSNGSWSNECDWSDGYFRQRIAVNESTMPSSWRSQWSDIKAAVTKLYAEMNVWLEWVSWDQRTQNAEINMWWRVLAGSTIGLAEFNNGSCWDNVFNNLDPGYNGSNKEELVAHELGHNHNLQHTRGGLMNPSIIPMRPWSFKGDPSQRTMERFFGHGKPVPYPHPVDKDEKLRKLLELLQSLLKDI